MFRHFLPLNGRREIHLLSSAVGPSTVRLGGSQASIAARENGDERRTENPLRSLKQRGASQKS
jgi:hypothetical protein